MMRKGRWDEAESTGRAPVGAGGEAVEEEPVPRERGDDIEGGGGAVDDKGEGEEKKTGSEGRMTSGGGGGGRRRGRGIRMERRNEETHANPGRGS